jgi:hypothetical protein
LWEKIKEIKMRSLTDWYLHTLSITQSSGTGKSRMIDELSKEHFVIPIVLRDSDGMLALQSIDYCTHLSLGYPPPDIAPRNWFTQVSTPEDAKKRAIAFLMALFENTKNIISGIDGSIASSSKEVPVTISAKFRTFMSDNQTYTSTGNLRQVFYEKVVDIAKRVSDKQSPGIIY